MTLVKSDSGFTLIEVLIALLVLGVGLLGLAGLQAASLKNNLNAYNRSQASQLAYDISDRMRANFSSAGSYVSTFMSPATATAQPNCLTTSGCTPEAMAENDLFEWHTALTAILSGSTGEIIQTGSIYTVNISWDENRDGEISADDPHFQMSFEL